MCPSPQKQSTHEYPLIPCPIKPHLGALQSLSSCSTYERVVIHWPCVHIPHDPRKQWPGGQDWQAHPSCSNRGDSWGGQRYQRPHRLWPKAELHGAADVTAGRPKEPAPPCKVHHITPGQSTKDAPDRPRTTRDAALDPPSSYRGESPAMTGGQRKRAAGGHAHSRCRPLPPNAAQGRLRKSLRQSRLFAQSNAL